LLVFEDGDREPFTHLLESLCDDLQPANTCEQILVEQLAMNYWRLHLAYGYEATVLRTPGRFLACCDRSGRYANTIHPQLIEDMAQLERLQRLRKGDAVPSPINVTLDLNGPEAGRLEDGFLYISNPSETESVLETSELQMIPQKKTSPKLP
jgi:hypothetical protein